MNDVKQEPNLVTNESLLDPTNIETRILELCKQSQDGISDSVLQNSMLSITKEQRLAALNRLLSLGKIDLIRSSQSGLLYRIKNADALQQSKAGDLDERLIYSIIKESSNKGIWIRDISYKTNLKATVLNKVLKNLESKKLIKSVTCVNASKKKVYMLYDLEPDRALTGGAWYSGKEFESEFVEILNEQCFIYLCEKRDNTKGKY
jgi:DNA-directed RNA polymerase III subunit RPC6